MNAVKFYETLLNEKVKRVDTVYINPNKIDRALYVETFNKVLLENGAVKYFPWFSEYEDSSVEYDILPEEAKIEVIREAN